MGNIYQKNEDNDSKEFKEPQMATEKLDIPSDTKEKEEQKEIKEEIENQEEKHEENPEENQEEHQEENHEENLEEHQEENNLQAEAVIKVEEGASHDA